MGRINSKTIFFGLYPGHPVNRCKISPPLRPCGIGPPEWVEFPNRDPSLNSQGSNPDLALGIDLRPKIHNPFLSLMERRPPGGMGEGGYLHRLTG